MIPDRASKLCSRIDLSNIFNTNYAFQNVYDALVKNEALLVDPRDAMYTIKIIEIALESANKKCTLPMEITV